MGYGFTVYGVVSRLLDIQFRVHRLESSVLGLQGYMLRVLNLRP